MTNNKKPMEDHNLRTVSMTCKNTTMNSAKITKSQEIEFVGDFLLKLYHCQIIGNHNDWSCNEKEVKQEFKNFLTPKWKEFLNNHLDNLCALFNRCGFLNDITSNIYKFQKDFILKFHRKKLNEYDQLRKKAVAVIWKGKKRLQVTYIVDENSPKYNLVYQGTTNQSFSSNIQSSNMSCYICQKQFADMEEYAGHLEYHNIKSEFKYLDNLSKRETSKFSLSYQLCFNSRRFCFTLKTTSTETDDPLIIDKIILITTKSMVYIFQDEIPVEDCIVFYANSHLFPRCEEHAIVVICRYKYFKNERLIEQHHIVVEHEYPRLQLGKKPYSLPSYTLFKELFPLRNYYPPESIHRALKKNFITFNTIKRRRDIQYDILSVFDEVLITQSRIKLDEDSVIKLILNGSPVLNDVNIFVCRIQNMENDRVSFQCYDRILDVHGCYTVIFRPTRLQLRYQYRGLELLPHVMPYLQKFLFPTQVIEKPLALAPNLELYNQSIANNPEQLQAVRNISVGPRNDATYIIFGPPGTGKTTTLVEAILQVLNRNSNTKILITASSNSACDELALRLCKVLPDIDLPRTIVRIYSKSSEARIETIDNLLLDHSNMYGTQFYPDIDILHEYRIVICTMSIVAKLSTGGFGRGGAKFSHIFIDEVAASTECEVLSVMSVILCPETCLIIAGDHKQLGPILQSKLAEQLQLGVSLMERLLKYDCYRVNEETGDYDQSIQTRLRKNFRSHPAIVNLYSDMYYNGELEARANIDDVSLTKHWHLAPNKNYPIIFHSIEGVSLSDKKSPSLYNPVEVEIVMEYVKDLMYFGINGKPLKQTDIGIISPYKKQYLNIRDELNLRKWHDIATGSVEIFQGQEKDVIITSFVRSGTESLGFLESKRRLNVTLSRPKSLLILIGNAKTLRRNADFDHIISECERNGTFIDGGAVAQKDQKLSRKERRVQARQKQKNGVDNGTSSQSGQISKQTCKERKDLKSHYALRRLKKIIMKEENPTIPNKENHKQIWKPLGEDRTNNIKKHTRGRRGRKSNKLENSNNNSEHPIPKASVSLPPSIHQRADLKETLKPTITENVHAILPSDNSVNKTQEQLQNVINKLNCLIFKHKDNADD
ncbi:putative helicase mov-10-B.2 [Musca autumnalis]|uniref:putative helicase mov-10-B.2 n=1 Tax=Musca autumnalis TaxID=221902 RepID=UPI003CE8BB52